MLNSKRNYRRSLLRMSTLLWIAFWIRVKNLVWVSIICSWQLRCLPFDTKTFSVFGVRSPKQILLNNAEVMIFAELSWDHRRLAGHCSCARNSASAARASRTIRVGRHFTQARTSLPGRHWRKETVWRWSFYFKVRLCHKHLFAPFFEPPTSQQNFQIFWSYNSTVCSHAAKLSMKGQKRKPEPFCYFQSSFFRHPAACISDTNSAFGFICAKLIVYFVSRGTSAWHECELAIASERWLCYDVVKIVASRPYCWFQHTCFQVNQAHGEAVGRSWRKTLH